MRAFGVVLLLLGCLALAIGTASCGGIGSEGSGGGPSAKKASNGDDAKDLHNRAQQAVNQAEACLAAVVLATSDTSSPESMASSLHKARDMCESGKRYLATNNAHGFSDQDTTLFASADEAKAATGAGLAYLDTQYPSKLADFQSHVQNASGYFTQGLSDLNSRLNELGVARVKK